MGAMPNAESVLDQAEKRVGKVLRGKYTIESVLGVGGMAVVYQATHRNQKQVAIKMLHTEYMARSDIHARFVREGYVANSVGHPGVVSVLDDDVDDDGFPYLVMELLEGATVESLCPPGGPPIPVREALAIVYQVLDVLVCAHERGIVHRDVKPANLFVKENGELKVLDFGVARLRDTTLDSQAIQTGALLGTPGFMAPEQALGAVGEIDPRTDLWSVGATLFTMLSGKLVHEGENSRQVAVRAATQPARSLAAVAPTVPPSVVRAVSKALMFQRVDRWQSAASMRDYVHGVHLRLYGDLSTARVATLVAVSQKRVDSLPTEPSPVAQVPSANSQVVTTPLLPAPADGDSTSPISASKRPQDSAPARATRGYRALSALGVALSGLFLLQVSIPNDQPKNASPAPASMGNVQVRVGTTMSVPEELDWLSWRVLRPGHESPLRAGFSELKGPEQLPLEFSAISVGDTRGTLLIEVLGRKGGESGKVQAKERVVVELPLERVKTLRVDLKR